MDEATERSRGGATAWRWLIGAALVLAPLAACGPLPADPRAVAPAAADAAAYGALPLRFEVNRGQSDPAVDFLARAGAYTLFLVGGAAVLVGGDDGGALRMEVRGAAPRPAVEGLDALPGEVNYLRGEPGAWRTGVPTYARVRYRAVYPGIDLIYRSDGGRLEYDFALAPRADAGAIRLAFPGATTVGVGPDGDLVVGGPAGPLGRMGAPVAYQEGAGGREAVPAAFALDGTGEVGFRLGAYDPSRPLVIDPVLVYATRLPMDVAWGVAVDETGAAYVAGDTSSAIFPASGVQPAYGGGIRDAFVAKLSPDGRTLVYANVPRRRGRGIRLRRGGGRDGRRVRRGVHVLPRLPHARRTAADPRRRRGRRLPRQAEPGRARARLRHFPRRAAADYEVRGVAVTRDGRAHVTGDTQSRDFPTRNALQPAHRGGRVDVFAAGLSSDGRELVYATYLGGAADDEGKGVALDGAGGVYLTGSTASGDFPIRDAAQPTLACVAQDAFVAKLSPDGRELPTRRTSAGRARTGATASPWTAAATRTSRAPPIRATSRPATPCRRVTRGPRTASSPSSPPTAGRSSTPPTGRLSQDRAFGVAVHASGTAYVVGHTDSPDFPTRDAVQPTYAGDQDAFVAALSPDGKTLATGTFLGGRFIDYATGVALDAAGKAYVVGSAGLGRLPRDAPDRPQQRRRRVRGEHRRPGAPEQPETVLPQVVTRRRAGPLARTPTSFPARTAITAASHRPGPASSRPCPRGRPRRDRDRPQPSRSDQLLAAVRAAGERG